MLGVEKLLNGHNVHSDVVSLLPSVHSPLPGVFFTNTPSNPEVICPTMLLSGQIAVQRLYI